MFFVRIIQLPETLANQIAAGEVVERPASVVKELVENSIDAKSSWIKIDLIEAGLEQIKVIDNGVGISAVDAKRAFLRHATSKIKDESDLFRVHTLGFRGEALASIASVSKVILKTSQGDGAGTLLELAGGEVIRQEKSDARKGTEITVNELFYNTPARLKYMKTIHTELGHITDILNRLALANPNIRFEATHNGKLLFRTSGSGDLLQVIAQVYGMKVARQMIPVKTETIDFNIKGYIGKPEETRATRSYISMIINGRYIRSHVLNQAVISAYHTLLPIHRFPIVVLSIEMDPYLVDVNVHPTKLEVRFSKEKELYQVIEAMIQDAFRQTTLIPEITQPTKSKQSKPSVQHQLEFDFPEHNGKEQANHHVKEQPRPWQESRRKPVDQETISNGVPKVEKYHVDQEITHHVDGLEEAPNTEESTDQAPTKERIPMMYPIGQLHGTYILAQNEEGLYMIDQHAAQERIKYETFKQKLATPINEVQQLLLPITFEFSKKEALFIERHQEELAEVGLFFEPFGPQSFIIRSYPTWFPVGYEEEIIREMVEQIVEEGQVNIEKIREESSIMMACKGSIKANEYLSENEMFQLLKDLRQTQDPFTCPHGRPIIVHFSTYELEKMFKRIM